MSQLCTNRPEGINAVSGISRPLPTQCFFDTILMPLPTWLLITALLLLAIVFPATEQTGRPRAGNPRQLVRRGTLGVYYFFAVAAVGMQLLEVGRLVAANLGVALLPFATVGTLLVVTVRGLSDQTLPLQRSAAMATSVVFWTLGMCMAAVKVAALTRFMGDPEEDGVSPQARQSTAYPVVDQIIDNAVLVGLYALLAALEPVMYFVLLPVVGIGGKGGKGFFWGGLTFTCVANGESCLAGSCHTHLGRQGTYLPEVAWYCANMASKSSRSHQNGQVCSQPGDGVSDRATQCHHSHTAAVLQASASSPHVCKPTGSGRTSLGATVKRVGCGEALCHLSVVGIKGDRLAVLHGAPQDNVVLPSDFDLDSDMEDDMGKLVNGDSDTKSHQTPPLSVLEAMDRQSRDADEYDPKLRRSPLVSQDEDSTSKNGQGDSDGQNCDILDYEVDWDEVMALIKPDACKIHEHNPSQPVLQYGSIQQPMATSTSLIKTSNNRADRISQPTTSVRGSTMLSGTGNNTGVRATSSISSVSNQAAALRVCFRIGEILNQGSRCFRNEQRAVFELFARVTYSSRETYARVQHFQFADFYKDYPPFLSGMMRNWEPDSILDSQAREFLGEGGPRFCRCTCRLQKSINTDTGWVISILSIRLSDQDEADSMRRATLT
ncbi:hypothetical protein OOU_Y34scaffold00712g21 [Pyricularia oryzae Y34]|uniref:Uncharacterized protein n=2 Tax=Pyricularia oryzae TaxID=318829 RepID=A0AA97PI45_PYRO3|nr:hypothetical protein OOU_Y34scaffold00712g21 [Pyricularia oryzae Y34]